MPRAKKTAVEESEESKANAKRARNPVTSVNIVDGETVYRKVGKGDASRTFSARWRVSDSTLRCDELDATYSSPSAFAKAVATEVLGGDSKSGHAVNGWDVCWVEREGKKYKLSDLRTQAATAPVVAEESKPVEEPKADEEPKAKAKHTRKPKALAVAEESKPAEESKAAEESKPVEEAKAKAKRIRKPKVAEEAKPAEESKPAEEAKAAEESKPAEEAKAAEESKPAEESKEKEKVKRVRKAKVVKEETAEVKKARKPRAAPAADETIADTTAPVIEILWKEMFYRGKFMVRNMKTNKVYLADLSKHEEFNLEVCAIKSKCIGKWVDGEIDPTGVADEDDDE